MGALKEKDNTNEVWEKLKDKDTYVVVQTAPAVRVGIGEEFGLPVGTNSEGKMITALKKLGFDKVFDTNTGADFTIMEEATEFLDRIQNGGVLPMATSCCPAWVKFVEMNYPESLRTFIIMQIASSNVWSNYKIILCKENGDRPK